jgi:UDP-glucose 4-epimerase
MTVSLVTGGAGFIGSNIAARLLSLGHEVRIIDDESSQSHDFFYWQDATKNYIYNICDYSAIRSIFDGVDYVFHLAAESNIGSTIENPVKATQINTLGTNIVLQCAKEAGVKRVVYSSTAGAYGNNPIPNIETQEDNPLNPYSVSKVSGEKVCKLYTDMYNLPTIVLRYFNVYGSNQPMRGQYAPVIGTFGRQKQDGKPMTIVGDGEQRRDFVNVLDVVSANINAALNDIDSKYFGTVFNIGSGTNYSVNDIANMIKGETTFIPEKVGEIKESLSDISKAKDVLGWEPTISLPVWLHKYRY